MNDQALNQNINELTNLIECDINDIIEIQSNKRNVKKSFYLIITTNDEKYFLKYRRNPKNRAQSLLRWITKDPVLKRQIEIYQLFNKQKLTKLNIPKFIASNNKDKIISQYVEGVNCDAEIIYGYKVDIVESLLEFQDYSIPKYIRNNLWQKLLSITLSIEGSLIIKYIPKLLKKYGVGFSIRCLYAIIYCNIKQKKIYPPFLIHSDFHVNNIIIDKHGKLYVSDLEGVTYSNKWCLRDITTLAVRTEKPSIDFDLLKLFINKKMLNKNNIYKCNMEVQVRVSLIYRFIQAILSPATTEKVKEQRLLMLNEVLLSRVAYSEWYRREFKKDIYNIIK